MLTKNKKNEPTEFYITFDKNDLFKTYEDINNQIWNFKKAQNNKRIHSSRTSSGLFLIKKLPAFADS